MAFSIQNNINTRPVNKASQMIKQFVFISFLALSGCGSSSDSEIEEVVTEVEVVVEEEEVVDFGEVTDANFEATDWTDETHNKSADPDFDEVFDDTQVKRLDF